MHRYFAWFQTVGIRSYMSCHTIMLQLYYSSVLVCDDAPTWQMVLRLKLPVVIQHHWRQRSHRCLWWSVAPCFAAAGQTWRQRGPSDTRKRKNMEDFRTMAIENYRDDDY